MDQIPNTESNRWKERKNARRPWMMLSNSINSVIGNNQLKQTIEYSSIQEITEKNKGNTAEKKRCGESITVV